eukprot:jgi/Ulvmu1/10873/UM007_0049.1
MRTGVARLLVLMTCMNHLVGCAWWYLGTVNIPVSFDGCRSETWHTHSAIPTSMFIKAVQAPDAAVNVSEHVDGRQSIVNASTKAHKLLYGTPDQEPPPGVGINSEIINQQTLKHVELSSVLVTDLEAGEETADVQYAVGDVDLDSKIPTVYIGGAWVPVLGPVPNVDEPAAFDPWVMYYKGLGVEEVWPNKLAPYW